MSEVLRETIVRPAPSPMACTIRVRGIVQGVGFRPFVYALAIRFGLAGSVANDVHGVTIEVEGPPQALEGFLQALTRERPPLAQVDEVLTAAAPVHGRKGFRIRGSERSGGADTPVTADAGTCDECLRELFDPSNRRYRYPFLNCTHCGPRFTIARGVPWDRPRTTMAAFRLCADCEREYHDPADRRFHAQPIACPACGPQLRLLGTAGSAVGGDPVRGTVEALRRGRIVAIKGLGGYHLAADAANEDAVARLRARKHREDKPFAVLVPDLEAARNLTFVADDEAQSLASPRRPIVLLRRRPEAPLAASVAPGNRRIGLMLPYTPVHHLLAREHEAPFVLTSGNVSEEPIAYRDDDALAQLADIADLFLMHDRAIETRTDDSVVRVFEGREMLLRRSRGYAPEPLRLPLEAPRPILACGAELKSTFCLVKGRRAFLSHHVGDLENWETLEAFRDGIEHYQRLFDVRPEVVACDLHPDYLSTKHALSLDGVRVVGVQHHHAHVASCLADNGEIGPVIGVAFDGLGFGLDGTLWGGEVLLASLERFERAAHLATVPLPGGAAAIREPWRMAAAWLEKALGPGEARDLGVSIRNRSRWEVITRIARSASVSPVTSSAGRLFDAVAAIVGVRDTIHYEGQAAVELEQCADESERGAYPLRLVDGSPIGIDAGDLVRAVVADVRRGVPAEAVAARFHNGLAAAIVEVCKVLGERSGLASVALSGGVFQNVLLLERTVEGLRRAGLRVLVHSRTPCNDGGISYGQAAVTAAREHPGKASFGQSRAGA